MNEHDPRIMTPTDVADLGVMPVPADMAGETPDDEEV